MVDARDFPRKTQPQADTVHMAPARFVRAVETVEDLVMVFTRNGLASVRDGQRRNVRQ